MERRSASEDPAARNVEVLDARLKDRLDLPEPLDVMAYGFATLVQSSAALVAIVAGFLISRVIDLGETHRNNVAPGVSAALLFDHPQVGRGWNLTIAPNTSRPKGMFAVEATEVILVEQGVFDLVIAGKEHTFTEGDNLITTKEAITSWRNPAHHPSKLFWFVLERFGPPPSETE